MCRIDSFVHINIDENSASCKALSSKMKVFFGCVIVVLTTMIYANNKSYGIKVVSYYE